jgi:hypothetical protein
MSLSDDQVAQIFGSLGRIEQKIDGQTDAFKTHVEDDKRVAKALFERLEPLQANMNRQKGALTVLGMTGSMLGAGIGYLVERFLRGH